MTSAKAPSEPAMTAFDFDTTSCRDRRRTSRPTANAPATTSAIAKLCHALIVSQLASWAPEGLMHWKLMLVPEWLGRELYCDVFTISWLGPPHTSALVHSALDGSIAGSDAPAPRT